MGWACGVAVGCRRQPHLSTLVLPEGRISRLAVKDFQLVLTDCEQFTGQAASTVWHVAARCRQNILSEIDCGIFFDNHSAIL